MGKSILKPCPFCGVVPEYPSGDGTQYEIVCRCGQANASVQICDLMTLEERQTDEFTDYRYGEQFILRAKKEASNNWNTRYWPPKAVGSSDVNYGFGNAAGLLEKVKRDRASLQRAINTQDQILISDSIFNFAITGYSIKDWLKEDGVSGVEKHVNSEPMLRLCADLCNGSKHKLLTGRREKDDPVQSILNSGMTFDMTTISWDSSAFWNGGYTVRIELDSGKRVEILDFANQVVDSWTSFIKAQN